MINKNELFKKCVLLYYKLYFNKLLYYPNIFNTSRKLLRLFIHIYYFNNFCTIKYKIC